MRCPGRMMTSAGWRRRWTRPGLPIVAGVGLVVGLVAGPVAAARPAVAGSAAAGTRDVVVGLKADTSPDASRHAASVGGHQPVALPANRYLLHLPADQVDATLAALRAQGPVAYAEVARTVHATAAPNDQCYLLGCGPILPTVTNQDASGSGAATSAAQGDLIAVGAPAAWDVTMGSPAVKVAVLDGPVLAGHPDLAGKVTVGPNICLSGGRASCAVPAGAGGPNVVELGHGTHVTGTVGASTNNVTGVASLGWNTSVVTYQVLDSSGSGTSVDLASGIYAATNNGARVINMSLAGPPCAGPDADPPNCGPDQDTKAAVQYAQARNVVLVVAAGNDGSNQPTFPASYPGILAVAATDNNGTVLQFSQNGEAANIAAPGFRVLSTWQDGNYATLSGTSMATPHVAAAAALMAAANPSLSGQQIVQILERTARAVSGPAIAGGMLNAAAALQAAVASSVPPGGGYELAGANGTSYGFGSAPDLAPLGPLFRPIVGAAATPDRQGGWLVASDGGVFTVGRANFYGSQGGGALNKPVVGMAATPSGRGYWLVASDGGVFSYGDAQFLGSMGGRPLNKPVVGMAAAPSGQGYWLVASDGGIFSFGVPFHGSQGGKPLNKAVVGMAAAPAGYWLVASDGGIFSFDATFYGSLGGRPINRPVVGIAATAGGYWLAASDGGVFNYGPGAGFFGSTGGAAISSPIVAITPP